MTPCVDFDMEFPIISQPNLWITAMTGHRPFSDLKKGWSPERIAANETHKVGLQSDLIAVDAHVLGPADYTEIPELTDEWFAKAEIHQAGRPVPRGARSRPTPNRP